MMSTCFYFFCLVKILSKLETELASLRLRRDQDWFGLRKNNLQWHSVPMEKIPQNSSCVLFHQADHLNGVSRICRFVNVVDKRGSPKTYKYVTSMFIAKRNNLLTILGENDQQKHSKNVLKHLCTRKIMLGLLTFDEQKCPTTKEIDEKNLKYYTNN